MRIPHIFTTVLSITALAVSVQTAQATEPQTSLNVAMVVTQQQTIPGAHIHYRITVQNTGGTTALQAYFDDYIHPNMFVQQLDARCGLILFPNGSEGVRCFLDDIAPGQSVTKNLIFRAGNNYECGNGSVAKNTASAWAQNAAGVTTPLITTPVYCAGGLFSSSASSLSTSSSSSSSSSYFSASSFFTCSYYPWLCGSSSSSFGGARTTLSIEKIVLEQRTAPGENLHYTITVRNTGSAAAHDVVVEDYVHPNMIATDVGPGCIKLGATLVRCTIGTLQPGQSAAGNLRFKTSLNYECGNGSVARNAAAASALNASGVTSAMIVTPVECRRDGRGLMLEKKASMRDAFPGDTVEYELVIENDTGRDLTNVTITDRFDARNLRVVDSGGAAETRHDELLWRFSLLPHGKREVIRYSLRIANDVRPGQHLRNHARVEAMGLRTEDAVTVMIIGSLPQTGAPQFAATSGTFLRPLSAAASMPLGAWAAIATAGLSAGGVIGRRFFL